MARTWQDPAEQMLHYYYYYYFLSPEVFLRLHQDSSGSKIVPTDRVVKLGVYVLISSMWCKSASESYGFKALSAD